MIRPPGVWSEAFRPTFRRSILDAGLSPEIVLDAGDAASYSTGQTWTDVSGNGRHFVRGADSGSSTDDPTFNGTSGQLSIGEFFSFDGGDFFTKSSANGTFLNGLHKDGATWGLLAAIYIPDLAAQGRFFATKAAAVSSVGVNVAIQASEAILLSISNGSANANYTSTGAMVANAWNVFGLSVTINGSSFHFINGSDETFTATVATPSASDAAQAARIGADGIGGAPVPNGTRLGAFAMFSSAPSQAQMQAMSVSLRARYGI